MNVRVGALCGEDEFKLSMGRASKIAWQELVRVLKYRQQRLWREADGLSPCEVNALVWTSV